MADKKITINIEAKNMLVRGFNSATASIGNFAKGVGRNLMNIKAGFDMLVGLAQKLKAPLEEAFKFESMTTQFKVLMGDIDQAKARMKELATFAAETPFELNELVEASRVLHVFSGGVMGSAATLRSIGDAAAAVGQPIKDVAFWVGRAYSMIKGGKPFGEAAMRLQEMGVITPEVRAQMEDLQKAGASNVEVWRLFDERLNSFNGGMKELSTTGSGLFSTMKDNWTAVVRTFGLAFSEQAKGGIQETADALNNMVASGKVDVFANQAKGWLDLFKDIAKGAWSVVTSVWDAFGSIDSMIGNTWEKLTGQQVRFSTRAKEATKAEIEGIKLAAQEREKAAKAELDKKGNGKSAIEKDLKDTEDRRGDEEYTKQFEKELEDAWKAEQKLMKEEEKARKEKQKKDEDLSKKRVELAKDEAEALRDIAENQTDENRKAWEQQAKDNEELAKKTVAAFIEENRDKKQEEDERQDENKKAKRLEALTKGRGSKLSKKDQEWLDAFNKIRGAAGVQKVAEENLKQIDMKAVMDKQNDLNLKLAEIQKKQIELSTAG